MQKALLFLIMPFSLLLAKPVISDKWFGLWGSGRGKATFEITSQFDFGGCTLIVNTKNISKIKYIECRFEKDKQGNLLICIKDGTRCIYKKHLKKLILSELNKGLWYVDGVANDDTLSVRSGAGVKYNKIYKLPHNAKGLKVLDLKMNGNTAWYKIKYKNITGWVSGKYLDNEGGS